MTISEASKYGLGKVTHSGNEFIDAWKKSKEDILGEIVKVSDFTEENVDVEGLMKFTRMMTMISKFEDLTVDMCKCMDAQIGEIRDLNSEINELKKEIKVTQDSIYELTNKVEEVLDNDEPTVKYTSKEKK